MKIQTSISDVNFTPACPKDMDQGLLGFITFTLNGSLLLDGIAFRKTLEGKPTLSFPCRKDGNGNKHFYIQPLDNKTRREVERQVFSHLGIKDISS